MSCFTSSTCFAEWGARKGEVEQVALSHILCNTRVEGPGDDDDDDDDGDNDDDGDVDVDDDDDQTPEKSCHRRSLALFCDEKILVKNLVHFFQLPKQLELIWNNWNFDLRVTKLEAKWAKLANLKYFLLEGSKLVKLITRKLMNAGVIRIKSTY